MIARIEPINWSNFSVNDTETFKSVFHYLEKVVDLKDRQRRLIEYLRAYIVSCKEEWKSLQRHIKDVRNHLFNIVQDVLRHFVCYNLSRERRSMDNGAVREITLFKNPDLTAGWVEMEPVV